MNQRIAALIIGLVSLIAAPAAATLIEAASVEELVETSDAIVEGVVVDTEAFLDEDGRVFTRVTIAPRTDYLSEDVPETLEVIAYGGRYGDLVTRVAGAESYVEGEEVLVFLDALDDGTFQSVGLSISKFTIEPDVVTGEPQAVRRFDAASLVRIDPETLGQTPVVEDYPAEFQLEALQVRIRTAIETRGAE